MPLLAIQVVLHPVTSPALPHTAICSGCIKSGFLWQGTCDQGSICSFAHGEGEMRRKGDPVPSIEYLRSLYTGAKAPDDEWCALTRRSVGQGRAAPEAESVPVAQVILQGLQVQPPMWRHIATSNGITQLHDSADGVVATA